MRQQFELNFQLSSKKAKQAKSSFTLFSKASTKTSPLTSNSFTIGGKSVKQKSNDSPHHKSSNKRHLAENDVECFASLFSQRTSEEKEIDNMLLQGALALKARCTDNEWNIGKRGFSIYTYTDNIKDKLYLFYVVTINPPKYMENDNNKLSRFIKSTRERLINIYHVRQDNILPVDVDGNIKNNLFIYKNANMLTVRPGTPVGSVCVRLLYSISLSRFIVKLNDAHPELFDSMVNPQPVAEHHDIPSSSQQQVNANISLHAEDEEELSEDLKRLFELGNEYVELKLQVEKRGHDDKQYCKMLQSAIADELKMNKELTSQYEILMEKLNAIKSPKRQKVMEDEPTLFTKEDVGKCGLYG